MIQITFDYIGYLYDINAQKRILIIMKKQILLISSLFLLASCGATPAASFGPAETSSVPAESSSTAAPYTLDLNVACPAGAPAVSLYRHLAEPESKLDINADPSVVAGFLTANSGKDIVFLPTNAGLTAITKKKAPYKIAATVTFGNFFLASTGNDENKTLDADDYVVVFQQGGLPDKVFQYVYGDSLTNVHYVNAATDAKACLQKGINESDNNASVDYVFIAEPALTGVKAQKETVNQYADMQEEFAKKSGGLGITQASIFVADSADKTKVNTFLSSIEEDIKAFLADPAVSDPFVEAVSEAKVQQKWTVPSAMVKKVTKSGNRMGLGFKKASESKAAIANWMKLFGINELSEEVYYQ